MGVNTCISRDGLEDKRKKFKLHLMNKGESGEEGREMTDLVKAKRQETSAQHPGVLKANPLSLHKTRIKKKGVQ